MRCCRPGLSCSRLAFFTFYEAKQERKERKRKISHDNYHEAQRREKRNLERVKPGRKTR